MPRVKLFDQEKALQKAMNLFWEKGYHATSMQDLVKELEISRGSMYDTFGAKQELFDKSLEKYKNDNLEWFSDFLYNEKDVKKGISNFMKGIVERAFSDPNYKGCFIVKTCDSISVNDTLLKVSMIEYNQKMERVISDYLRSGNLDKSKNFDAIAKLILTINTGLSIASRVNNDEKMLNESIDVALQLLD